MGFILSGHRQAYQNSVSCIGGAKVHFFIVRFQIPRRKDKIAAGIAEEKKFQLRAVSFAVCAVQLEKTNKCQKRQEAN